MLPTAKLTKRQKKGVAFRERKHTKSKDKALGIIGGLEDGIDVPSLEDQVLVDDTQAQQHLQVSAEALVGKGKAGADEDAEKQVVVAARKTKRKAGEEAKGALEPDKPRPKRRKGSDGSPLDDMDMEELVEDDVGAGETGRKSEETKQRFILFLGTIFLVGASVSLTLRQVISNIPRPPRPSKHISRYVVCIDMNLLNLNVHVSKVPPPTVRLLTPKPSTKTPTKTVMKSKGCAFLEFKHRGALQQGLKLHHSELDGRQINVELTAGGGGKGLTRTTKLKERNKELEGQRVCHTRIVDFAQLIRFL